MAAPRTIQITHAGRAWSGSYTVEDRDIVVASAYGSKRARSSGGQDDALARTLLADIVDEYVSGQANKKARPR